MAFPPAPPRDPIQKRDFFMADKKSISYPGKLFYISKAKKRGAKSPDYAGILFDALTAAGIP